MFKNLYLIITIFVFAAYGAATEQIILPIDENMADYLIDEGELDSSMWSEIQSYYVEKISVPHGELFILREIFPQLPDDLPVDPDELQEYVPWNKKKVEQFFIDYPYLQDYRQILDFSYMGSKQSGKIGFTYYESDLSNKSRQSAQILTNPVSWVKFQSRIDFTAEFARWQRRSLQIKPAKWLTLDLGNYTNTFDQGLIFGNFPYADNKTTRDNWLYAKTGSWNGARISASNLNLLSGLSINTFFHKRDTEMAFGFDSRIRISKPFWFQTGLSNLSVSGSDSNLVYFHCGSEINISKFRSQIVAA
ncbi:MAG: hypothetical protein Q4F84_04230, partial [Fibrobacter sp.]|nr:hypothetical protein [Fibrobacter sp.]